MLASFFTLSRPKLLPIVLLLFCVAAAPKVSRGADASSPCVRILMVADTLCNGSNSLGIDLNRDAMERTLRSTLSQDGIQYTLDLLQGIDVSPAKILNHYKNLRANPNDTVVFYYTGHGAFSLTHGHLLATSQGPLLRSELRSVMLQKKARLTVILTDACANIVGFRIAAPGAAPRTTERNPDASHVDCSDDSIVGPLFLKSSGLVDLNGAQFGSCGFGRRTSGGSFFTVALVGLLTGDTRPGSLDPHAALLWNGFFASLKERTEQLSFHGLNDFAYQTPQAYQLPKADLVALMNPSGAVRR